MVSDERKTVVIPQGGASSSRTQDPTGWFSLGSEATRGSGQHLWVSVQFLVLCRHLAYPVFSEQPAPGELLQLWALMDALLCWVSGL